MVAIEDTTTNKWWNGSSFNDATQSFVAAIGNTTWLLSLGAGSLTSGDSYSVVAQVTDSAGDVGTSSTVSFTYNTGPTAAPTVSVTYPVDGITYGADWTGTITGTASSGASTTITGGGDGGNRGHHHQPVVERHRLCCQQPELRGGQRQHDLVPGLWSGKSHRGQQLQRRR